MPNVARKMEIRAALVNGFGFGGQNGVLVLKVGGLITDDRRHCLVVRRVYLWRPPWSPVEAL